MICAKFKDFEILKTENSCISIKNENNKKQITKVVPFKFKTERELLIWLLGFITSATWGQGTFEKFYHAYNYCYGFDKEKGLKKYNLMVENYKELKSIYSYDLLKLKKTLFESLY